MYNALGYNFSKTHLVTLLTTVVIASASRIEDREFEVLPGFTFFVFFCFTMTVKK
jgi:hypothetical protein